MSGGVLSEGQRVDERFLLETQLGVGSFGEVWRAKDEAMGGQVVAIKVLFEKHRSDKKKLQRFEQEARILERVQHPNIAHPVAWRADSELAYLVMELIDGDPLDVRLGEHAREDRLIPKPGVSFIADQLSAAIGYAHQHHVVHRDLKPKNVMINRRGRRPFVKVLDFGIAKVLVGSTVDPTTVGRMLGSVLYISPEQVLSRPIDARADVFALASILFEVLTLRRTWARGPDGLPLPFHQATGSVPGNAYAMVLRRIAFEPRPRASEVRPDVGTDVDDVFARALAIDPEARHPSAEDLARDLRSALTAATGAAKIPAAATESMADPAQEEVPTVHDPSLPLEGDTTERT